MPLILEKYAELFSATAFFNSLNEPSEDIKSAPFGPIPDIASIISKTFKTQHDLLNL